MGVLDALFGATWMRVELFCGQTVPQYALGDT
jgi:hypothetical protein